MFITFKLKDIVVLQTLVGLLSLDVVRGYTPPGRWGHTLTYIPSTSTDSHPYVLLQGGRSDPTNSYSYTSAPLVSDETVWLSLDGEFDRASVPWLEVPLAGGSTSGTADHGAVCWGVSAWVGQVGADDWGYLVSFGGDGGPLLPVQTNNDSLSLSHIVSSPTGDAPVLDPADVTGSGEPVRRWSPGLIRLDDQRLLMSGGLKGDGSGMGYRDAYLIDSPPDGTIKMIPQADLPVDLAAHQGVKMPSGEILVLGGWSPSTSTLSSMDKGYLFTPSFDPSSGSWRTIDLTLSSDRTGAASASQFPPARRGFTLTLVSPTKAILFGGIASVSVEEDGAILSDIWQLDLEELVWKQLGEGQVGRKRAIEDEPVGVFDHSAVGVDGRVLVFGGRTSSGMADSGLFIYDVAGETWTSSFTAISQSARSNADGFASNGQGGSQAPISAGPDNVGGQASEVVVTRTAANGDVILSTTTMRTNPTKAVVVTTVSTGIVVTTDSAGLTVTSTIKATLKSTSTGLTSPTERPGAEDDQDSGGNKKAIALGTVFGCFGLIGLALLAWLIRRKRQGKIISSKGFIMKPWGGRPDRGSRRAYPVTGEGAQSLMDDHIWDGTEKMFTPIKSARGAIAYSTPTGPPVPMKGYTASANPYSPGHPTLLTNFMDRLRNVSGRGTPRFDILADEDRSDVWRAPREVVQHEKVSSGRSTQTDQGQSMESEEFRIHHPAIPSSSTQEASEEEGVLAEPVAVSGSQARRRVSGKVLPATPLRDPFEDPIENYYDAGIIDYADGVSADHSSSSFTSRESARNSVSTAAIQTAVKVDFSNSAATYLPLKRNSSLISRLAGAGASLFGGSRASRASITETDGFLDPTPPPGLDPIAESTSGQTSGPSSRNSCNAPPEPYRNQSYTSIETSATATSDMLANYGNMQIIQRERTASSRRQSISNGEADLGDVFMARLDETAPPIPSTPPRANSPRPREHTTPKGPRTAPPRHPTHIDLTPRRTVKDLADSINRRDFASETPVLPTPNLLQATPASFVAAPPVMHSPYRGLGGPRGPRRPTTMYEVAARGPLTVANPE